MIDVKEHVASKFAKLVAAGAFCGLLVCAASSTAVAGSVEQPGETVGLSLGAPIPEGVYYVDTLNWGVRSNAVKTALGVNIPVIAWSTPWTLFNGRVEFFAAWPELEAGTTAAPGFPSTYNYSLYNPIILGNVAWDLGNGFGFRYGIGNYFDYGAPLAWSSNSLRQDFSLSYTGNNWDLTATVIYGIGLDQFTPGRVQVAPCINQATLQVGNCNNDYVNLDLTATKKFGKWELGPVAFGSWDVSSPVVGYQKQSEFAVGGLVGYNFGPVNLQAFLTRTVAEQNYGGFDTRGWVRITVPLWNPATPVSTRPIYTK
ncbi:MAG TPA: transporter [Xanthobacteraceae bacterium]|jgi:hypothetical protein